jgi:hypothetical protein
MEYLRQYWLFVEPAKNLEAAKYGEPPGDEMASKGRSSNKALT